MLSLARERKFEAVDRENYHHRAAWRVLEGVHTAAFVEGTKILAEFKQDLTLRAPRTRRQIEVKVT